MNTILIFPSLKELPSHAIKTLYLLVILFLPSFAIGSAPDQKFGDWSLRVVHSMSPQRDLEGVDRCFIYTTSPRVRGVIPKSDTSDGGSGDGDDTSYLYLVKKGYSAFTFGVSFDYELAYDKYAIVEIDDKRFPLNVGEPHEAWSFSSSEDVKLIDEMLKNDFLKVRGYGLANGNALNYYSLKGFSKALVALNKC